MIKHIVMFKMKEINGKTPIENALLAQERASVLADKVPSLAKMSAVVNSEDAPESNYEFALVCDFENIEALNAYQIHPEHVEFGKFITPIRELRACIDYQY